MTYKRIYDKSKVYKKRCGRCKETYKTYAKHSHYCIACNQTYFPTKNNLSQYMEVQVNARLCLIELERGLFENDRTTMQ